MWRSVIIDKADDVASGDLYAHISRNRQVRLGAALQLDAPGPYLQERPMERFRSIKTLQKFFAVHGTVQNQSSLERHLIRNLDRERCSAALAKWLEVMRWRQAQIRFIAPNWGKLPLK